MSKHSRMADVAPLAATDGATDGHMARALQRLLLITLSVALSAAPMRGLTAQPGKADFDAGVNLMGQNKPGQAESKFERAVAADDKNGVYHLWLGRAVGMQAQTASKIKQPFMARRIKAEFERAVQLDPDLLDARDGLISFYLQAPGFMGGSPEKAREQQREIAKRSPLRGHLAASNIAWFAKDTVGTERSLRAAIAAEPDTLRVAISLAQRQAAWGRTAAAFTTLDEQLARRPDDIALRFQVGRLAASTGQQLARGEQVLRALIAAPEWEATNLRPSKAAVHYRLGMILEKSGRTAEAKTSYQQAVTLEPELKAAKDALASLK